MTHAPDETGPSTVRLHVGNLSAEISPRLGMTVTSLRYSTGPELLWSVTAPPTAPPTILGPPGDASRASLTASLAGGWFEMNPNAGLPAGADPTRTYFHGESVRRSWLPAEVGETALDASVTAWSVPVTLRRRFELDGDALTAITEIQNEGDLPIAISPGEHPCFARSVFAGGHLEADGRVLRDGIPSPIVSVPDDSRGNASVSPADATVTLRAADGRSIVVAGDAANHDRVGIWWNFSAASDSSLGPERWDCIAIEPMSRRHMLDPGATYRARTSVTVPQEWS